MPNGIGRVWVANSGDEGRPNGVGPVWIENISALGPGGGGDIPSEVSGKWEEASDCVEANSGTWGQGGSVSLPLTGSSNNTTATYDSNSAQFEYSESEGEPTHNLITVDPANGWIEIKNSSNEDETWSTTTISPYNISLQIAGDSSVEFDSNSVTSWDSTWSTVESNSANWAGGNFSGVTVSNSLTGDGKNTPLGLNAPIVAQNNEATGTFSQYGNSFRNGDAYAEYSASNINLKVTGGSPYISAVSYDYNNDFLGSVSLNSTGVVFKDSMGGVTQFGSAAVDSWVDTRTTVRTNSASWGQGTTYSAGTGILINNNEISVDTMTIPDYNTVTGMIDTATGNIPTPVNADWSATTGLAQILNKPQTEEITVSGIDAGSGISITTGTSSFIINFDTPTEGFTTNRFAANKNCVSGIDDIGLRYKYTYEEDNALRSYSANINYISGVVGDVESLLASL